MHTLMHAHRPTYLFYGIFTQNSFSQIFKALSLWTNEVRHDLAVLYRAPLCNGAAPLSVKRPNNWSGDFSLPSAPFDLSVLLVQLQIPWLTIIISSLKCLQPHQAPFSVCSESLSSGWILASLIHASTPAVKHHKKTTQYKETGFTLNSRSYLQNIVLLLFSRTMVLQL